MSDQEGSCSAIVWQWSAINMKTNIYSRVNNIPSSFYGETVAKNTVRKRKTRRMHVKMLSQQLRIYGDSTVECGV